jgi:hypothetical protein
VSISALDFAQPNHDCDAELYPGSSGAWVIATSTQTVIGHIIADDPFGDVYIVPIVDILADVKAVLDAKSVSLPTREDISNVHGDLFSEYPQVPLAESMHGSFQNDNHGKGKPPVIVHNGGGQSNDPNTSTSAPNSGYWK